MQSNKLPDGASAAGRRTTARVEKCLVTIYMVVVADSQCAGASFCWLVRANC